MQYRSYRPKSVGFTLIELLVVLAILGMLAALVGPKLTGYIGSSKTQAARVQIRDLEQAVEMFSIDVGRYPNKQEGLQALVNKPPSAPIWNGPYLRKALPMDPWGNPFHYDFPGKNGPFDIYSLGMDNAPGGEGENADVGNWQ